MIVIQGHRQFSDMTAEGKPLIAIYAGVNGEKKLIWERIRSCYGTGIWLEQRPWTDNDLWKDNK